MRAMRLCILQHVPFESAGSILTWASKNNHEMKIIRLFDNQAPPSLLEIDALFIMGGPMSVHDEQNYDWLSDEKKYILNAIKQDKIVLGICLGAQLIAHVLGARVFPNPVKEIGWFPITKVLQSNNHPLSSCLPNQMTAFHWHGDTFDIPPEAIRISESTACKNQGFIYKKAVALQYHLEVGGEEIESLIENCGHELVSGAYIQSAAQIRMHSHQCAILNQVMDALLDRIAEYKGE